MTIVAQMFIEVQKIKRTYNYSFDSEVAQHLRTLRGLTVEEAMKSIVQHLDSTGQGCCLYMVTKLIEEIPEATFGYIPKENSFQEYERMSCKVVAIANDNKVFDVAASVDNKRYSFIAFCNIPLKEYCESNLRPEESMVILPNPRSCLQQDFMKYFFDNPDAINFGR